VKFSNLRDYRLGEMTWQGAVKNVRCQQQT
jgi:hypothetical protein